MESAFETQLDTRRVLALNGIKILVVEDSQELLFLFTHILCSQGALVHTATSMCDALSKIDGIEPDVLLSDISMPNGSGIDLIQTLRTIEKVTHRHLPAAAITSIAEPYMRRLALKSGFDECRYKPISTEQLLVLVKHLIRQSNDSTAREKSNETRRTSHLDS